MTFGEYVQFYGLTRSEGVVLRYLADAYKALRQTVPDQAKTEELTDLIEWLGELVRQVDSSLIDEWERLSHPDPDSPEAKAEAVKGVTRNTRAFRVLVRNSLFRRVTLAALHRYGDLGELDGSDGWTAAAWAEALEGYFELYDEIGTGPDARGPARLLIEEGPTAWTVRQIFDDPAGDHDWGISATVDLLASDADGAAVVHVTDVGQL
jgi:glutathione S-transferase